MGENIRPDVKVMVPDLEVLVPDVEVLVPGCDKLCPEMLPKKVRDIFEKNESLRLIL